MKKNLSIHWGHDSSLCLATNKEIIGFIDGKNFKNKIIFFQKYLETR